MKIYLATDHAGFGLKEKLKTFLRGEGHQVEDCGAFAYSPDDDYPDFIRLAAAAVSADPEGSRAIILGGSGQGEAIAANRFLGVRAVVYYGGRPEIIKLSREHNDANVLSFGARFVGDEEALQAARDWLAAPFSGEERHRRRIRKLDSLRAKL